MTQKLPALKVIDDWVNCGWLSHLDRAFVKFITELETNASHELIWAAALVSQQLSRGEVYLDMEKLCQNPSSTLAILEFCAGADTSMAHLPSQLAQWKTALQRSSLVGTGQGNTPLVLDGDRLYLRRYWQCQQILNNAIDQRLQPVRDRLPESLQSQLNTLYSDNREQPDWQKIACILALRARFTIITGGPGTGKTTTLTKLLALLVKLAQDESNSLRKLNILLAAPTGKAAARVSESIGNALERLNVPEAIKQCIPKKASTLHRLLGHRPNSRHYFHHRNNTLVADVVIVDEASMIDLEMMASLLDALPMSAQLILLGDKDQLASVEAGSVMGDLCRGAEHAAYNEQTKIWINQYAHESLLTTDKQGSALNQQTVMLRYSHRFGEFSGIGQLAKAVNEGKADLAQAILNDPDSYQDIQHILLTDSADSRLKQLICAHVDSKSKNRHGYGDYLVVIHGQRPTDAAHYPQWAKQVLAAYDSFRILCALRQGCWGVEGLNQQIEKWLFPQQKPTLWYEGRPVMITRNDYNLGLMNGDVGMTLYDHTGKLRVFFPSDDISAEEKIRWVSPMRLPDVETAFAMTVHKSQGSEFNHVALILPETRSPVITRELIYTGITRAQENFTLLEGSAGVFNQAILVTCKLHKGTSINSNLSHPLAILLIFFDFILKSGCIPAI